MSKYTIKDVKHIIPQDLTAEQISGVEEYLNNGTIPPFDPCRDCNPAFVRRLISLIQIAESTGLWPPKRSESKAKPKAKEETVVLVEATDTEIEELLAEAKDIIALGSPDDPNVDFTEVFKDK